MRISILGHKGKMGQMLAERLKHAKHDIRTIDLPFLEKDLQKNLKNTDIILLCIPAKNIEEICRKISPYLLNSMILMDITSVKILPLKSMEKIHKGPIIGTHPLFGPRSQDCKQVCFCKGTWFDKKSVSSLEKKNVLIKAKQIFTDIDCQVFFASAQEHDKAMAAIQGLNFVSTVAYFAMIANLKNLTDMENIENFFTPSYSKRLESARTLIENDGNLFTGIFKANPMSQEIVKQYKLFLNIASGGDMEVLLELARKAFQENNKQNM